MPNEPVSTLSSAVIEVASREDLARALGAIGADEDASDADRNRRLVETLKTARAQTLQSLETALDAGAGGFAAASALCLCQDHIIQALFDYATRWISRATNPTSSERLSVAAVGGYGR